MSARRTNAASSSTSGLWWRSIVVAIVLGSPQRRVVDHGVGPQETTQQSVSPQLRCRAGIGRTGSGAVSVRASYREAEQALAMGRKLLGTGITSHFTNLGLHRLLFAIAQHQELGDFYEDTVGALVAYDARTGGDLMATLGAFFACHGSPTETAQRLHLHRNTVLYRLRRIEEVGSLSLDDAATRLNLHLCLRIREVLPTTAAAAR